MAKKKNLKLKSLPIPSQNQINEFIISVRNSNRIKAKELAEAFVDKYPGEAEAHAILSQIYLELFEIEPALNSIDKSILLKSQNAGYHNNKGVIYVSVDKFDEAISCFNESLRLNPNQFDALNNLGGVYLDLKKYDLAQEQIEKALTILPQNYQAIYNLGNVYRERNELEQAEKYYDIALGITPNNAKVLYAKSIIKFQSGDIEGCKNFLHRSISIGSTESYQAAVDRAVLGLIENDIQTIEKLLLLSEPITKINNRKMKIAAAYWILLNKLIDWIKKSQCAPNIKLIKTESIYVLGESHSLAYAALNYSAQTTNYNFIVKWIPGCKQYHLSVTEDTQNKVLLRRFLDEIPNGSTAVFVFGEIDCRIDEGIIEYCKSKNIIDMYNIVMSTCIGYVDFVKSETRLRGLNPIIQGIPAPTRSAITIPDRYADLVQLIKEMNDVLKLLCQKSNIGYIDVYAETADETGLSNEIYHIDEYHLSPTTVARALNVLVHL